MATDKVGQVGISRCILDARRLQQELVFAFYIQRNILLHSLQKHCMSADIHSPNAKDTLNLDLLTWLDSSTVWSHTVTR